MGITSEVYQRGPARFDMCGQRLPSHLSLTSQSVTAGLASRLVRYAAKVMEVEGFLQAVNGWSVTVGTNDACEAPADRWYWVSWINEKGASLSVIGILTRKGWPCLDHGLQVERA